MSYLQASAACGHILGSLQRGGEFLVAVRRAGDVIGEMESLGERVYVDKGDTPV